MIEIAKQIRINFMLLATLKINWIWWCETVCCQLRFASCYAYARRTRQIISTHCSKSSFFVQKFKFDFPRKLSIFFLVKNSWKCFGLELFGCWQLWFQEKNCQKNFGLKTREIVGALSKLNFWTKIWLFE